jgi:cobalt-zinc-cadmium efflux system protein
VSYKHDHGSESGNIGVAFFLNLVFTLIELAGGLWTNSIAILSDALHDSGDCITLGFAWYMQRISRRPGDRTFTYGYRRFSVLGALITGVVLLAGLLFIVWKSAARLMSPEPAYAPGMIAIAIVGIVFNGAAVLRVRGGSSLNEKVISWHLLEDVLGWAAVLIGSIAMLLWELPIIDPLLSIGISLFVLWNVIRNLRKVLMVFMQSAPKTFDSAQFQRAVSALPKAVSNHHTHVWSIDGEHHVLSTHLVMQRDATREEIVAAKDRVHEVLAEHDFEHVTIDVELEGEECVSKNEAHADPH